MASQKRSGLQIKGRCAQAFGLFSKAVVIHPRIIEGEGNALMGRKRLAHGPVGPCERDMRRDNSLHGPLDVGWGDAAGQHEHAPAIVAVRAGIGAVMQQNRHFIST